MRIRTLTNRFHEGSRQRLKWLNASHKGFEFWSKSYCLLAKKYVYPYKTQIYCF
jgi:hypothetical protein